MKTIFNKLDDRSRQFVWRLSAFLSLAICVVIFVFGYIESFQLLFVFPVVLASWYGSQKSGLSLAIVATALYLLTEVIASHGKTDLQTLLSNGFVQLIIYIVLALIVTNFRNVHRIEVNAADTDSLTGINSRRSFYAELSNEIVRSKRYKHVFSLAYLDIDDFKNVNDSMGHATGDKVLKEVARIMNNSLRKNDTVARIGGDEFVCLLPETDEKSTKTAFIKTIAMLNDSMKNNQWPVTFSVGVVTFSNIPSDEHAVMHIADKLMYEVKNDSKNDIAFAVW